ncbi:MAG: hypothetical protein EXR77_05780 [Myxococcales bacterium]|nr:hypothetical protein [Myxococcales bacterium]
MNTETSQTDALLTCPTTVQWLQWLTDREAGDVLAQRSQLQAHLDECVACKAAVSHVRRYQTLLLRGKAPALSQEQRQSLDERIRLQAGNWSPPSRVPPWLLWGTAVASAAAIALLVMQPFGGRSNERSFAESVKLAAVPTADNPGLGVAISLVEGDVEVATADGRWRKLAANTLLRLGSRLRATQGGRVVAAGRFELVLQSGSEIEALAISSSTAFVRVRRGELQSQVDKLKTGHHFAVMFGAFRASVVGTRFAVRQDATGAGGRVDVTEGAVRVDAADDPASPNSETMTVVRAGHRWQHVGGVMSLEPIRAAEAMAVQAPEPVSDAPVKADGAEPSDEALGAQAGGKPTAKPPARVQAANGDISGAPLVNVQQGPVVGPRQIVIEVPHQTMPPQEHPNAPDSGSRGQNK